MYRYRLLDQEKNASFLSKFAIFFQHTQENAEKFSRDRKL
jgi:hypothetical protein